MEDPRVAAFIASDQHSKAVEFIDDMILRGRDPDFANFDLLNRFTEAENANQVINTIAFATEMISFDNVRNSERSLMTGNVNLSEAKFKSQLETLVGQLPVGDSPRYRFVLIPLALGQPSTFNDTWKTDLSMLIKTRSRADDNCYVDMSGRVYRSFQKFLIENKLPFSVLCYPSDGAIELNAKKHVKLSYAVVGEAEKWKRQIDDMVNTMIPPSIFNVPLFTGLIMHKGFRGVMELVDCYQHETMNPLKFPHTIEYYANVVLCFGYFTTSGMQFFKSVQNNSSAINGLRTLNESIKIIFTTTNVGAAAIDLLTTSHSWNKMELMERMKFAFSLCFQYRLAPSLENGEKALESGRIETLCNTFKHFVTGSFNMDVFKNLVYDLSSSSVRSTVAALLFLASKLIKQGLSVELSEDFVTIKIGNHKLHFQNILRLTSDELEKLGNLFDQKDGNLSNLRSKLRELFGDGTSARLLA